MKKIFTLILICFALSAKADYWTQKASFPGTGRSLPFSFSIGDKGYTGCGDTASSSSSFLNDFWEYDQLNNTWTQMASFPGLPRIQLAGFSIFNKGYAGLGAAVGGYAKDFYEYDPAANAWTQKADFPGRRNNPVGFSIGDKGFAGMGTDTAGVYHLDIWEYDPPTDTWTQKQDFGGAARITQAAFSIGNFAYVGLGYLLPTEYSDFWQYDKLNDIWTQVANFPGPTRGQSAYFTIGNFGYVGTGNQIFPLIVLDDFWQYDPVSNTWTQKADFGGTARDETVFFSINNKGYIGLGWHNGLPLENDFWEYTDSTTNVEESAILNNLQFTIVPNPAKDFIVLSYAITGKEKINLTITDVQGKKVYTQELTTNNPDKYGAGSQLTTDIRSFSNGVYFVTIDNGKEKAIKKFVKK